MSEATERPWRMSEDGEYVYSEASDRVVCDTPVGLPVTEEDEANLDLIVRAVNTHEEAIGLLRALVGDADSDHNREATDRFRDVSVKNIERARAFLSRLDAGGTER